MNGKHARVLNRCWTLRLKTISRCRSRRAIILLDVRNVFDSIEWGVLQTAVIRRVVSPYLRRILNSYLENRYILDENGRRQEVTAGVPQASVLGPTLWNVGYEALLAE